MYHHSLGQDGDELEPQGPAPPGWQYVATDGGWQLQPITQGTTVETPILATQLVPPTPVSTAPSTMAPMTAAPTSGIQQLLNALSPAPTVTPTGAAVPTASTFDYWLSQTTGGVSNTTIFWGGILIGGALLVINMFKRKR